MSSAPFRHRNLPLMLLQARESLMAHFRPYLAEHGLTDQQWRIVRELYDEGPREPRQLCERCQISSPSITGMLARMEDLGLVSRRPFANDRRRISVELTRKGLRIAKRIAPQIEAKYQELEARIGVHELRDCYDVLDALMSHVDLLRVERMK